jgi:hypothetical protein
VLLYFGAAMSMVIGVLGKPGAGWVLRVAVLALLGWAVARGARGSRVGTWIMGGFAAVLLVITVASFGSTVDDRSSDVIAVAFLAASISLADDLAVIAAAVLVAIPASRDFFCERRAAHASGPLDGPTSPGRF